MKKSKFVPPYRKAGKTTFPETINRSGVYLSKENNKLVYIGFSGSNLYKTMYRHFERWHHKGQEVINYFGKDKRNTYSVRVVLCTAIQAMKLERVLIKKHKPRDNSQMYIEYDLKPTDLKVFETYQGIELVDLPEMNF